MPAVNEIAPIYADEGGGEDDLYLPRQRPKKDVRSKLLRSKSAAAGMIVNACPFDCPDEALDAECYCPHLVGFTDPTNDRVYYPLKWREDPKRPGSKRFRYTDGEDPQPRRIGDQLVRITTCCRVYRQTDEPGGRAPRISNTPARPSAGDLADAGDGDLPDAELDRLTTPAQ